MTISGNTADSDIIGTGNGGGVSNSNSTVLLANTLIAGNSDLSTVGTVAPDCTHGASGVTKSQGYNLIGDAAGCGYIAGTGDLFNVSAQLGPLADNGGPTPTQALLSGSPAFGAGKPAMPGSTATACAAADQRGTPRAQGARCDIGAFEVEVFSPPPGPPPGGGIGPSNAFTVGKAARKKVSVAVPGPGLIEVVNLGAKKLLKPSSKAASVGATVKVPLRVSGTAKRKLKSAGKLKVSASFTFTPTGGSAASVSKKLKLKAN